MQAAGRADAIRCRDIAIDRSALSDTLAFKNSDAANKRNAAASARA
jgi:hypothetical protein